MPRRDAEISMWFSTMKTADPFPLLAKPQRWGQYHQLPHHSSGQQDCAPSEQRSVYSLPLQSRGQSTHCPFRAEISLFTAPSELRSVYSQGCWRSWWWAPSSLAHRCWPPGSTEHSWHGPTLCHSWKQQGWNGTRQMSLTHITGAQQRLESSIINSHLAWKQIQHPKTQRYMPPSVLNPSLQAHLVTWVRRKKNPHKPG